MQRLLVCNKMVSKRRTRRTIDEESGEATTDAFSDTTKQKSVKSKPKTKELSQTRRMRSNSTAKEGEVDDNEEEVTPAVKQKRQSTRMRARKRLNSIEEESDADDDVEEETIGTTMKDKKVVPQQDDEEENTETEMARSRSEDVKPAFESIASISLTKEKQPTNNGEVIQDRDSNKAENELTKLIPGYVAPLKLGTSSLDSYRPTGGLAELCKRAQQSDASTAGFVVNAAEPHARTMKRGPNGCVPSTYASLYSSFKHGTKPAPDHSAGAGWFGMVPTPVTDELKTDLAVIRNRNYLDPKRFYKSADNSKNKVMQLGTVIEGSAEFYSSRLTKKQRRTNLTEEIMADPVAAEYTKSKYKKMQQAKSEKGRRFSKKKLSKRARRGY